MRRPCFSLGLVICWVALGRERLDSRQRTSLAPLREGLGNHSLRPSGVAAGFREVEPPLFAGTLASVSPFSWV